MQVRYGHPLDRWSLGFYVRTRMYEKQFTCGRWTGLAHGSKSKGDTKQTKLVVSS